MLAARPHACACEHPPAWLLHVRTGGALRGHVQVERLSGLVTKCSEALAAEDAGGVVEPEERLRTINCTVALQKRIISLFSLIENDFYGVLMTCSATIASFRPRRNLVP